jgi:hypothetical protein
MRRPLAAAAVLALAAAGLVGCDWQADCEASGTEAGASGTCVITTPNPTVSPTATPTSSPSASPTPTASPTPSPTPPPGGWPTPATTGVPAGTTLTGGAPCSITAAGVYTARRWTCRVEVGVPGVVIRDSELVAGIQVNGPGSFVIEDSTIGPASGCTSGEAMRDRRFTAKRVHVRNFTDGARSEGPNVVVEDSYFQLRECSSADHGDAFQGCQPPNCSGTEPNTGAVFRHNTVDQPNGSVLDGITANVFWSDGSVNGLVFTDNLLKGGGYTIRIHAGSGHTVTGNRIVDGSWRWGPADCEHAGTMTWSDNRLVTLGTGYSVASTGAAVSCG